MKPAWLVAERSINQAERRYLNLDQRPGYCRRRRHPTFRRHRTMALGEWWPMPRGRLVPKPGRLRRFLWNNQPIPF